MTLDEALHEAVSGARMTAPHMAGVYIEHSFARGFLRCWPVDKPEDEPNRTQCDFNAKPEDRAATDWFEIEAPVYAVDHSPVDAWGKTTLGAIKGELKIGGEVVGTIKSFKIEHNTKRDMQAEALALIGSKPVECAPFTGPEADAYHATLPPVVPSKWGVPIPGAAPVLDIDVPKRDAWGRPIA